MGAHTLSKSSQIEFQGVAYPCHSSLMALHSNVLAKMFASDSDPNNWTAGVEAVLEGASSEAVQVFLATVYFQGWHSQLKCLAPERDEEDLILEALQLAHKLDSSNVQRMLEDHFIVKMALDEFPSEKLVSVLEASVWCGSVRLQGQCITEKLVYIISKPRHAHSGWEKTFVKDLEELVEYDFHLEVRKRLNRAMVQLIKSQILILGFSSSATGIDKKAFKNTMVPGR